MLCSKSVWQLSKTVQMPQSAGGASPAGEWRLFLNETYSTRIPFFSAFRAIRLCSRHLMPGINQHHHLGYSLQPLPADDGGGFGMQHFHPGLRLSQLSDVLPGQQRRKSGGGVIKQTTFQPAHILSLLCVDTTNTL